MSEPKPDAYRPFASARYPLEGKPDNKPEWRVLVHRKHLERWSEMESRCGQANSKELWVHLTTRPNQEPLLGTCTPMKGGRYKATDGWSRVFHYEITGAARVDYRYAAAFSDGKLGDEHKVVQIISIDYGSH